MNRTEKAETVESLKGLLSTAGVVVVSRYSGLTVAEMTALRVRLREAGAGLKVVKNRLLKIAIDGTPMAAGASMFTGPTAIAFSADPVAATKVAAAYAKEKDKFVIIGGLMGDAVLDEKGVKTLAELPSLDQLRGKIIGLIHAPATKVAGVLQAPAGQLARVIGAYAAKEDQQAAA
jgi:large subunit ribosomal protein L10